MNREAQKKVRDEAKKLVGTEEFKGMTLKSIARRLRRRKKYKS